MAAAKSSFLDRVLERLRRLDREGLETVVQRLARERTFLETLFNTIEDGVLVADEKGRILYVNLAATRMLGLDPATAEGESVQKILPELGWEKLARFDRAGGKRVSRHEFDISYPRPRLIHLYAAPLDGEAVGSYGVALILHDATEARQRTQEAIESQRIQALTLLAASVAHEIGNPLNALDIHLQLLEREVKELRERVSAEDARPLAGAGASRRKARPATSAPVAAGEITERLEQYLTVCKGEVARLDYIIRDFLQALRPAAPKLQLTGLNDVVRATLDVLRPEIVNRGITITEKLSRTLPMVPIDPGQIKQALVNLIKNAIQAMSKGGVLRLQTDPGVDGVVVSVADTGGGIPEEQINRIFEPFYTTKQKGSGLGLMIVQRIVRDHRGRIDLESHVGKGSVFRIWLPLHERPTRLIQARHD